MAEKEVLVVASKVKAYIKSKQMHTSSDALLLLVTRFVQYWMMLLQEQRLIAAVQSSRKTYRH